LFVSDLKKLHLKPEDPLPGEADEVPFLFKVTGLIVFQRLAQLDVVVECDDIPSELNATKVLTKMSKSNDKTK